MARNGDKVVPRDVATLKRPALQKLCKQLGLKANGKVSLVSEREKHAKPVAKLVVLFSLVQNTEMVRSLEEYRETHALSRYILFINKILNSHVFKFSIIKLCSCPARG